MRRRATWTRCRRSARRRCDRQRWCVERGKVQREEHCGVHGMPGRAGCPQRCVVAAITQPVRGQQHHRKADKAECPCGRVEAAGSVAVGHVAEENDADDQPRRSAPPADPTTLCKRAHRSHPRDSALAICSRVGRSNRHRRADAGHGQHLLQIGPDPVDEGAPEDRRTRTHRLGVTGVPFPPSPGRRPRGRCRESSHRSSLLHLLTLACGLRACSRGQALSSTARPQVATSRASASRTASRSAMRRRKSAKRLRAITCTASQLSGPPSAKCSSRCRH